jgi:hypothetical protein
MDSRRTSQSRSSRWRTRLAPNPRQRTRATGAPRMTNLTAAHADSPPGRKTGSRTAQRFTSATPPGAASSARRDPRQQRNDRDRHMQGPDARAQLGSSWSSEAVRPSRVAPGRASSSAPTHGIPARQRRQSSAPSVRRGSDVPLLRRSEPAEQRHPHHHKRSQLMAKNTSNASHAAKAPRATPAARSPRPRPARAPGACRRTSEAGSDDPT